MDKTYVICEDGSALLYLSRGKVAVVDQEDLPRLLEHCWYAARGYAWSRIDGKLVSMHRFLTDPGEQTVHHLDEDGLNNRRSNLMLMERGEHTTHHKSRLWRSKFEGSC